MHVASLERCRELYKLSGWADTPYVYYKNTFDKRGERSLAPMNYQLKYRDWAYDLGYLVRKLTNIYEHPVLFRLYKTDNGWVAGFGSKSKYPFGEADTPEDAAAKLAIELFKQGVLKREES